MHPREHGQRLLFGPEFLVKLLDQLKDTFVDEAFRLGDVGHGVDAGDGPFESSMGLGILRAYETWVMDAFKLGSERPPVMALREGGS